MFRTLKRIIHWTGPYKKRVYLGFVCSLFVAMTNAAAVCIAGYALAQVLAVYRGEGTLDVAFPWVLAGALVGSVALRALFMYLRARLQESIGHEIAADERIELGDMLKRAPLGFFSKHSIGDILAGMTTELSVLELQGMKMVDALGNGYIFTIVTVLFLAVFNWQCALVGLIAVILSTIFLERINHHARVSGETVNHIQDTMTAATIEYVRGLAVVKSFKQVGAAIRSVEHAYSECKKIRLKIEWGFVPNNALHLLVLKLAGVGVVWISALIATNGQLSLPFLFILIMFSTSLFGILESTNDAAHILGTIDPIMDKLDDLNKVEAIDADGADTTPENHDIRFDNVGFSYDDNEVIHDVSLAIQQGSTTALIGPSGSGKTTLVHLIARFYDVDKGSITLGGHDLRTFTCDSLLRNITMVFQNVYLFNDTVENNIKFGRNDATHEEVIAAARAARCDDFIEQLPHGYETVIGEGGGTLSGGQKQRISIARAILKDAPIVILDEATASIDPENERAIQQAISSLTKGKTVITIAHRLATIENADQIVVLEDGRVAEQGTHAELIARQGVYHRFIAIREKAEGWTLG